MKYSAEDYKLAIENEKDYLKHHPGSPQAEVCMSSLKLAASIAEIPVSDIINALSDIDNGRVNIDDKKDHTLIKILTASLGE